MLQLPVVVVVPLDFVTLSRGAVPEGRGWFGVGTRLDYDSSGTIKCPISMPGIESGAHDVRITISSDGNFIAFSLDDGAVLVLAGS